MPSSTALADHLLQGHGWTAMVFGFIVASIAHGQMTYKVQAMWVRFAALMLE